MLLKRIYDKSSGEFVLDHIKVIRANKHQRFSTGFVNGATAEGWLSLDDEKIVLHTEPELTYKVERTPGYYCCHCGSAMPGGPEAKEHVKAEHAKKKSPDHENPAGYMRIDYFDCAKEE
jgi:hypothetical protein